MISARLLCVLVAVTPFSLRIGLLHAAPFDPKRHMRVDEVKPGMTGFGKSVFQGTRIDEFQAEVIQVIKNFDPKLDVILVRLSGQNLEHSGIIGGMSGSPVYLRSSPDAPPRLIGAVAYGWTFNKDPICGVQPIEHMLEVGESTERLGVRKLQRAKNSSPGKAHAEDPAGRYALAGLIDPGWRETAASWADAGGLRPLATPLMVSGLSESAMELLRSSIESSNLVPMAAGSAPKTDSQSAVLEPGAALCIPMITGDTTMSVLGTCTEVIGDQVYGFGHPFTRKGAVRLPMATGTVHTVISSVMRSFKLGGPIETRGAILGDGAAAVFGKKGASAKSIPITVQIDEAGQKRTYRYQSAVDEFFTPMLSGVVILNSVTALADLPAEHTLRYQFEVDLGKYGTFKGENISSQQGAGWAMSELANPIAALMDNQFGRFDIKSISATVRVEDRSRLAHIKKATLQRQVVKPGQSLDIRVQWDHYRHPETVQKIRFDLPEDIPEGTYQLALTSAQGHIRAWHKEKPHLFNPEHQAELVQAFNRVAKIRQDRLYARLNTKRGGLAVKQEEFPDLPPFRRAILAESTRERTNPYLEPVVKSYEVPFVAEGKATLTFTVDKRADQ